MSFEFFLPKLGEGVKSGTVIALSFKNGDKVKKDDPILEIETDKAAMGLPSPVNGTIEKYCVKEGQDVKIGDLIAVIQTVDSEVAPIVSAPKTQISESPKEAPFSQLASQETIVIKREPPVSNTKNQEFRLPPLGEGIKGGNVLTIFVKIGDTVKEGDPIVELETDKAAMSVPAPVSGKIDKIFVVVGKEIKIGEVVCEISGNFLASTTKPENDKKSVVAPTVEAKPVEVQTQKENNVSEKSVNRGFTVPILDNTKKVVRAGPATRKFARELGVDLTLVAGSKRQGRIDVQDVKNFVKSSLKNENSTTSAGTVSRSASTQPLPDFSRFGKVKREPLPKIRKIISERMTYNWNNIPHVFQFQEIDITGITELGKKYSEEFKEKGSTSSPTNFFIKAMVHCLKAFPKFNASLDDLSGELVLKEYFNIGVAVDTPAGLIVPVLRDVDKMSIFEIGKNLKEIAARGRERKITPDEMTGACLTLSNLGGIGGTSFTPIVNWPEVAILGVAKAQIKPVYIDNAFVPRTVVTVCLSYDHRVIDGADAARFVVKFKDLLENYEKSLMGAI